MRSCAILYYISITAFVCSTDVISSVDSPREECVPARFSRRAVERTIGRIMKLMKSIEDDNLNISNEIEIINNCFDFLNSQLPFFDRLFCAYIPGLNEFELAIILYNVYKFENKNEILNILQESIKSLKSSISRV